MEKMQNGEKAQKIKESPALKKFYLVKGWEKSTKSSNENGEKEELERDHKTRSPKDNHHRPPSTDIPNCTAVR
jgi:hypothetical protein